MTVYNVTAARTSSVQWTSQQRQRQ